MLVLNDKSVHALYAKALSALNSDDATEFSPKQNTKTKNLHNVALVLKPKFSSNYEYGYFDRTLYCDNRKLTRKVQCAEFSWYMTESNRLDIITPYIKGWSQFSDDGETVNSNYGYIWQKQIKGVIKKLLLDKYTRQAAISIYDKSMPNNFVTKDINCTMSVVFNILPDKNGDDALHMTVNMRSNDVIFGLPIDMFCFSMLHELVCNELRLCKYHNLLLGTYTHIAQSLHIYNQHYHLLDKEVAVNKAKRKTWSTKSISKDTTYTNFWNVADPFIFSAVNYNDFVHYINKNKIVVNGIMSIAQNYLLYEYNMPITNNIDIDLVCKLINDINSLVANTLACDVNDKFDYIADVIDYANNSITIDALMPIIYLSNENTYKENIDAYLKYVTPNILMHTDM